MNYGKDEYSTTVFGEAAARFIRDAPAAKPLFVYYAPYAPHEPDVPATQYADRFQNLPPWRPPNFDKVNASAPAYLRARKPLSNRQIKLLAQFRRRQYATLLSVDDEVGSIVDALRATGRLSNTMIVFASDNGLAWGAHRLPAAEKRIPYDEATRVPFVVRYDPMTKTPRTDTHMIVNTDWAPTFAALAGVSHPKVEGRSFLPIVQGAPLHAAVAHVVPARELGRQSQDARTDVLRDPQHALPVRAVRDGRAGALRPAARSVRPEQRGELAGVRERARGAAGRDAARVPPAATGLQAAVTGVDAVRRRRLAAQLLAGRPARSAAAAAGRLLAIQAQNLRAGRLAVRARTAGLTAAGVNAELERRDVVITWLCRGTLHLVCRDDYPWLLGLAAPTLRTGNLRRLDQCGYPPDRARRAAGLIVRMLADEGPLSRAEIGRRLEARRVRPGRPGARAPAVPALARRAHRPRPVPRRRAGVRAHARLARRGARAARGGRPPARARRARPPLPGRARPGDGGRPGAVGRPAAA